jgi:hypothetical protein
MADTRPPEDGIIPFSSSIVMGNLFETIKSLFSIAGKVVPRL